MALPKYDVIQTDYRNPDAKNPLKLNVIVVSNTPEEKLQENIIHNSSKYPQWLSAKEAHDGVAVLIGGGWSINECIEEIKALERSGATIISMNGSTMWCKSNGITPHWQVIVDAKEETAIFVDAECKSFFASQCNPKTTEKAGNLTLVHFGLESIEDFLPEDRVKSGGYTLLGCGTTVGNAALAIAFSQGYRKLHIFGYDSSYHDGNSHGYRQDMNRFMPTTEITWNGKTFKASVAMKSQAEKFQLNAMALKTAGCEIHVYGDGLLQTIYNTKPEDLTEREKYQLMWNIPVYREVAPGEHVVDKFIEVVKPDGKIIDFGCGTGRAALKLAENYEVILVDFTDNCRDNEAFALPFIQADLTEHIPVNADYGFCTDVMEHIEPDKVDSAILNIMSSVPIAFFQISTVDDICGQLIGQPLHLSVHSAEWWKNKFIELGYTVDWMEASEIDAKFVVKTSKHLEIKK